MEIKLLNLTQGDLTVAEYEAKFTELARFLANQVDTDEKKARRFEQGLKFWIQNRVAMFELTSYVAVVQKAMVIESKSDMSQKGKDGKKRKIETSEGGQQLSNFQSHFNRRPEFQVNRNMGFRRPQSGNGGQGNRFQNSNQQRPNRPPIPDCQFCGRKHFGNCNANVTCFKCGRKGHFANVCQNQTQGQNVGTGCYKCGKPGHISRNCPTQGMTSNTPRLTGAPSQNLPRIEGPPAKDQPKARTFNMTMKDVVQSSDMVAGTLPVNSVDAKVLFDSGATRSLFLKILSINCIMKLSC